MKRWVLTGILFFTSCSQAGILPDSALPSVSPAAAKQIHGRVGIGQPLLSTNISVIDVTDSTNPKILATFTSDSNGEFVFELPSLSSNAQILFSTSGGNYLDPLTFQNVINRNLVLSGVWKVKNLFTLEEVHLTPFSTLAASFYRCLTANSALAADPVDYSIATFKNNFGIDLNKDVDNYLIESVSAEPSLYSAYNLAFSRMAKEKRATSAADLILTYSQQLEDQCDLLGPKNKTSGSYSFHSESFRKDYLNAVKNLRLEPAFTAWMNSFDVVDQIEEIRAQSNVLFQYEEYLSL